MIKSIFIRNLLEKTIQGEESEKKLLKQIKYLSICEKEYTECGYFIYLESGPGIEDYTLSNAQLTRIYGTSNRLENIQISNINLNILANITVHFSDDGIIDCLEIFNNFGTYPKGELITYEIIKL